MWNRPTQKVSPLNRPLTDLYYWCTQFKYTFNTEHINSQGGVMCLTLHVTVL